MINFLTSRATMLICLSGVILMHAIWAATTFYRAIRYRGNFDFAYYLTESPTYSIIIAIFEVLYYLALSSLLTGLYLRACQKHNL